MLEWLKGKAKGRKVESRFEKDSADLLQGMGSADLVAGMLKIPETEVELPLAFKAVRFEEGRVFVANSTGPHGLSPGTPIPSHDGLPPRRAEGEGLESIALADLSTWMARRKP
jgi:hypothetical protein